MSPKKGLVRSDGYGVLSMCIQCVVDHSGTAEPPFNDLFFWVQCGIFVVRLWALPTQGLHPGSGMHSSLITRNRSITLSP